LHTDLLRRFRGDAAISNGPSASIVGRSVVVSIRVLIGSRIFREMGGVHVDGVQGLFVLGVPQSQPVHLKEVWAKVEFEEKLA